MNELVVYITRLGQFDLKPYLALLPMEDQIAAEQKSCNVRKAQFTVGRTLLRFAYRHFLNLILPVSLDKGPFGKPFVQDWPDFSVSHSNDLVTVAICTRGRVGVDIEKISYERNIERLIRNYANPQELKVFANLDQVRRVTAFYELWTMKEACAKSTGAGLSRQLQEKNFYLQTKTDESALSENGIVFCSILENHALSVCTSVYIHDRPTINECEINPTQGEFKVTQLPGVQLNRYFIGS